MTAGAAEACVACVTVRVGEAGVVDRGGCGEDCGGFDLGADAGTAVGEGQDAGGRGAGHHAGGQRGVVDAAVVAAHDQRDPAVREGVQRGQRGQHVGGEAVVDEADAGHGAGRGEPARQRLVAGRRRAQPVIVAGTRLDQAQRDQAAAGDERVAAVVPAGKAERLHPVRARVVALADPLDPRPEQRGVLGEQVAVAVGHGELGARLGARGQLVPVVLLHSPVPVQVIWVQRGHRDHRRRARQVGGLVTGDLDDPVVIVTACPASGSYGGAPMFPPTITR